MNRVQEGQYIAMDQWIHWDAERIAQLAAQEVQSLDSKSNCSDSTILYDFDSDMASQNNVETESVNSTVDIVMPDINQLRAEMSLLGGSDSPPPDFVMPTNYIPTSPAYSPRHSPINITSDSEHGYTPPQNDSPIITRASLVFDLPNDDSDLEHDREVELINLVGDYVNRNRIPIQISGVYLFPQDNNIHDLKWEEYPTEACSDHCVIPLNSDKSFGRFYLTHSLCLKHRSTMTNLGPWLYLSNKVSTLPKLYKSHQITQFITLMHQNIKRDQSVKNYLAACHLVENNGPFTLLIRVDVYMTTIHWNVDIGHKVTL